MESAEEIAWRAAKHAYEMHVQRKREFEKSDDGRPVEISTPEQFKNHILYVLECDETLSCTVITEFAPNTPRDLFYHPATNTLVIVPEDPRAEPTAFRPDDGLVYFHKMLNTSTRLGHLPEVVQSIYELRPELAAAKEAERIKQADKELYEAVDKRYEAEKKDLLSRQQKELEQSVSPESDKSRHAKELQALRDRTKEDFERYRRERENALQKKREHELQQREQQELKEGRELGRSR